MVWGILILIFIVGVCSGSYVNMLVYRTAVDYKLLKGKKGESDFSYCDFCCKRLSIIDNIPIVSWLVLKGKSRCCKKKLPLAYPITELGVGLLFGLFFYFSGKQFSILLLVNYLIIVFLVFNFIFDLKYKMLPDFSNFILIGLALLIALIDRENLVGYILGGMGASGFLGLLFLVTKGKGMGVGDVKYALFMGLILGWERVIVGLYIAFVSGAMVGMVLLLMKKVGRKSKIPFGPFLIFGTVVAYFFGKKIIELFIMSL